MSKRKEKEYEVSDHGLSISSIRSLYKISRQNKVDKKFKGRWRKILIWTILTQPFQLLQKILIYFRLKSVDFDEKPPIFLIGHWRSGTTHLHYLLANDPHFGFLSNYQAFFMRMSFIGRGWLDKIVDYLMPNTRPQDNVIMNAYNASEEEQPFSTLTYASGIHSFFFPRNQSYHDKFNLFKGIAPKEKREWQRKYNYMLKLISLANQNKPLLLKNPHNTSRVKELLELYPNAKFIYIHRNPFDVYLSTTHLYEKMLKTQFLQEYSDDKINDRIFYNYSSTIKKYLADRDLIPEGNLVEVSFSELEENALKTTEKIYKELNIPNYESAKIEFTEYLKTLKDYKKNAFEKIDVKVAERIQSEWRFAFDEWVYPLSR